MWVAYTPIHVDIVESLPTDCVDMSDVNDCASEIFCMFPTISELLEHTLLPIAHVFDDTNSIIDHVCCYNIPSVTSEPTCNASTWSTVYDSAVTAFLMLHLLLSHVSYRTLYEAIKTKQLLGFPHSLRHIKLSELPVCEIDRLTKSHVKPKTGYARNRAEYPGEMWHSDLKGPFRVKSIRGFYYWMTFIDDFSGYCYVYFLKYKSDALIYGLKRFVADVLIPFGIEFCVLVHDPGGEYSGQSFQKYCYNHGITPQPIPSKNPHYNGVAENKNRILAAGLRATRLYAKLPAYLWCCIVETVNDMLNITPRAKDEYITPYYRWHGFHPTVSNLHIIGAECYLHDPDYSSSSLKNTSEIVRFLGYVHHSRSTYRLWRPSTGKLLESNHVTFIRTPLKLVSPYDIKYINDTTITADDDIEFQTVTDQLEFEKLLMHERKNENDDPWMENDGVDTIGRSAQQRKMTISASDDSFKRRRIDSSDRGDWPPLTSVDRFCSASSITPRIDVENCARDIQVAESAPGSNMRTAAEQAPHILSREHLSLPIAIRRTRLNIVTPERFLHLLSL